MPPSVEAQGLSCWPHEEVLISWSGPYLPLQVLFSPSSMYYIPTTTNFKHSEIPPSFFWLVLSLCRPSPWFSSLTSGMSSHASSSEKSSLVSRQSQASVGLYDLLGALLVQGRVWNARQQMRALRLCWGADESLKSSWPLDFYTQMNHLWQSTRDTPEWGCSARFWSGFIDYT